MHHIPYVQIENPVFSTAPLAPISLSTQPSNLTPTVILIVFIEIMVSYTQYIPHIHFEALRSLGKL